MSRNKNSSGEWAALGFLIMKEMADSEVAENWQSADLREEHLLPHMDVAFEVGKDIATQPLANLVARLMSVGFSENYLEDFDQKPSWESDEQELGAQLAISTEEFSFFPTDAETSSVRNALEAVLVSRRCPAGRCAELTA